MFAPSTIQDMALRAARKAARNKRVPLVLEAEDVAILRAWKGDGRPMHGTPSRELAIPFLGDYVPKGWTRTEETYFVDSSGFGAPGELALTFARFLDKVIPGRGYAVVEAGQFQVYVAEYIPPRAK